MSVQVVAVVTARAGSEDVVRQAFLGIVAATRQEPGCLSYSLSESTSAPGTFVSVEEWSDPSDLDAHMSAPHVQSALGALGSELAGPPAIHLLKPLDVQ